MRIKTLVLLFAMLWSCLGISQQQLHDSDLVRFRNYEKKLIELSKSVFYSRNETIRFESNKQFLALWDEIVKQPKSMAYGFDSLKKDVSILVPRDKKFRLITWNLHKNDGSNYAYFGYIQVNNEKRIKTGFLKHDILREYEHFKLIDKSAAVKSAENYMATPDKWFGMLYYYILDCNGYYLLLAWDGNDNLTQRKFVDVLSFKSDGTPTFGKDVFKFPKKNPKRLMFEYSTEVSMSLKYNERRNQIVYSHLAPKDEGTLLEGQPQYYGPDGSYDALEQRKDKWVVVEAIDARNPKNKNDKAEPPDPDKQTPVYKPK
jgi:hypothetical protein